MTDPIREAFVAAYGCDVLQGAETPAFADFTAGWHADRADLLKQTAAGPSPATTEGLIGRRNSTGVPQ